MSVQPETLVFDAGDVVEAQENIHGVDLFSPVNEGDELEVIEAVIDTSGWTLDRRYKMENLSTGETFSVTVRGVSNEGDSISFSNGKANASYPLKKVDEN